MLDYIRGTSTMKNSALPDQQCEPERSGLAHQTSPRPIESMHLPRGQPLGTFHLDSCAQGHSELPVCQQLLCGTRLFRWQSSIRCYALQRELPLQYLDSHGCHLIQELGVRLGPGFPLMNRPLQLTLPLGVRTTEPTIDDGAKDGRNRTDGSADETHNPRIHGDDCAARRHRRDPPPPAAGRSCPSHLRCPGVLRFSLAAATRKAAKSRLAPARPQATAARRSQHLSRQPALAGGMVGPTTALWGERQPESLLPGAVSTDRASACTFRPAPSSGRSRDRHVPALRVPGRPRPRRST